jgi:hypothetical protein
MALPKFNDIPNYELVIPSSKRKVKFRPFLVKEQKVLLMALESRDDSQILNSITNTIQSCILENIDVNSLTTFDVEYIFIQIRTKAAGETSNIGLMCSNCEQVNQVKVNLEDIKIDVPTEKTIVKLNEEYSLQMQYPQYKALLQETTQKNATSTEQLYGLVAACLHSLQTEEEQIMFKDETSAEVEEFLDQLTADQFDEVMKFTQSIPKLSHEIDFDCESCGTKNNRTLEGLTDFFQLPSLMTA